MSSFAQRLPTPRALLTRALALRPTPFDGAHHLVALVVSIAFGLSFGLTFGGSNQTGYFLGAFRLLEPGMFDKDWYAAETANYHPIFTYLGWLLMLPSRAGWGVALAQVVAVSWGALGLYALCRSLWAEWGRRLEPRLTTTHALATWLLLMAVLFETDTASVAVSYVFDGYMQPSTLGGLFFLLAIPPLTEGKWLRSGVFLGLSGAFHANYLLLGIGAFGLCHLYLGLDPRGREGLVRRLVQQVGPAMIPFAILAPMVLETAGSPDAPRAQEILFMIRSPHHYNPRSFEKAFIPFAAWHAIGFGVGSVLLRKAGERGRRLGALFLSIASIVWVGTVLTTVVYVPKAAQLFVWRLAPFLEIAAQLLVAATIVHLLVRPAHARQIGAGGWIVTLVGAAVLAITKIKRDAIPITGTMLVAAALCVGLWMFAMTAFRLVPRLQRFDGVARRVATGLSLLVAIGSVAATGIPELRELEKRSSLLRGRSGPEEELYAWIREHTPRDAVFLTPPEMERFRLGSERAIVVDHKSSTILPGEVVSWYQRLGDVSGRPQWRSRKELAQGYAAIDRARIDALRPRYGFDYAVVDASKASSLQGELVYRNGRYGVVRLP